MDHRIDQYICHFSFIGFDTIRINFQVCVWVKANQIKGERERTKTKSKAQAERKPNPTQLNWTEVSSIQAPVEIVEEFLFCHSIKRIDWLKSLKHVRAPAQTHTDADAGTSTGTQPNHNKMKKIHKKIVCVCERERQSLSFCWLCQRAYRSRLG